MARSAWLRGAAGSPPGWDRQGAHRRLWVTDDGRVAMTDDPVAVLWRESPAGELPDLDADGVADGVEIYLGQGADGPLAAVLVPADSAPTLPGGASWQDLKAVGHLLDDRDTEAALTAVALARWHQGHRFSPATGRPTEVVASGWVRRDDAGGLHFPRTDAAVIMAVVDADDRLLMARGRGWPEGRMSVLAGFVEPGESLEQAVAREVLEEVGVQVSDVRYAGSQPWPFPASLMVGFTARAGRHAGTEVPAVQLEHDEIAEARWFTRAELRAAVDSGALRPPGAFSIARRLVEGWLGESLPLPAAPGGSRRG